MDNNYLNSTKQQFEYYKMLGEKTFSQLEESELFWKNSGEDNCIAVLVNHLWGNMMSRWTNFLTEDGEKDWRNRDQEFENIISTKQEMLEKWNEGWKCLFTAIESINESNFSNIIYIRNQGHSVTEAINRQLCHYSYHIGQIVLLGKLIKGNDWNTLSIAKGNSSLYNETKFSEEKKVTHFTEELLNDN
jgi:hypothetical protein